ncbi:hypothetical protein [Streptomyces griseus]|uniref:hypothetical protein n=1 Tax=Streptomyces griseus TaxID=1911 RepID=UPI000565F674|nr:hypothetical protein [Streptomyces griseus]
MANRPSKGRGSDERSSTAVFGGLMIAALEQGVQRLRAKNDELGQVWSALREGRPPRIDTLTLEQVVTFFVDNKGSVPDATAGAAVRRAEGDGYLVHLVYLDAQGQPLLDGGRGAPTRSYLADRLDEELAEAFGAHDALLLS